MCQCLNPLLHCKAAKRPRHSRTKHLAAKRICFYNWTKKSSWKKSILVPKSMTRDNGSANILCNFKYLAHTRPLHNRQGDSSVKLSHVLRHSQFTGDLELWYSLWKMFLAISCFIGAGRGFVEVKAIKLVSYCLIIMIKSTLTEKDI